MATQDPARLTATEAAALMREGKLSAVELAEACLARIAARDADVQAWMHLDPDLVRRAAKAADATPPKGPLHGIPFAVKDVIDTADLPTEYGSAIFAGNRPAADAACVAKMKAGGAVLMGKTVSTEFATYRPGKTRNPHNPAHTPGGSSSGSGAAVGDSQVPLAFGTQTAGSHIRPAAFNGVCALKPTFGTVDLTGALPLEYSFDTLGYMARSFDDVATFYAVVRGMPADPLADGLGRAPRVAVVRTPWWELAEAPMRDAIDRAARRCAELGADVGEVRLPPEYAVLPEVHATILHAGLVRTLGPIHRDNRERMGERLQGMIADGMSCTPERLKLAIAHAEICKRRMDTVFGDWDVFLTPSAPGEAPEGLAATGNPIFQVAWTLLHVPCANVPYGKGPKGLPLGVQLVGRQGEDDVVLRVAKWLHARV